MILNDDSRIRRASRLLPAVGAALLCGMSLAGCGADQDTAGPERGVTVGDVQEPQYFHEGEYLGRQVTVSARVTNVLGPRAFELAGGSYGDDSLLVETSGPTSVEKGQVARVTGTVGQYHFVAEEEGVPPVQYDMYEKYETEAYLHDSTVEVLPA